MAKPYYGGRVVFPILASGAFGLGAFEALNRSGVSPHMDINSAYPSYLAEMAKGRVDGPLIEGLACQSLEMLELLDNLFADDESTPPMMREYNQEQFGTARVWIREAMERARDVQAQEAQAGPREEVDEEVDEEADDEELDEEVDSEEDDEEDEDSGEDESEED
jgi:hypothetical protein